MTWDTLKEGRPEWIDKMHEDDLSWMLFDPERNRLKFSRCETQKEAIKEAISHGIIPRSTQNVVPMRGGYRTKIMSEGEFQNFMERIKS